MNFLKSSLLVAMIVVGAAVANAEVTTNVSVPGDFTGFVPCANGGAGEAVDFTGNLHILFTFTINDNRVSGKFHFQPQGMKGVGQVTGDAYQANGVTQEHFSGSLVNGQFSDTYINNFRLIGKGKDNNLLVKETIHFTVNANGDVTAVVVNSSVECK